MTEPKLRVAILVTHLLGVGHLVRAAALARAFMSAGHETLLITGGMPVEEGRLHGLDVVQLPPIKIEGTAFNRLLLPGGEAADESTLARRIAAIEAALARFPPDVLILELYPFGRRALRREFRAAIAALGIHSPRAMVLSSIRDILAPPSKPEKAVFADEEMARHFAGLLVHGEAKIVPLSASWPVSKGLATQVHYTGYVEDERAQTRDWAKRERSEKNIVVSGGASAAGLPLFVAAIEAARLLKGRYRFHLLVGDGVSAPAFDALCRQADALPVLIERTRPDFRALLGAADASISRAGYNTVLDIAATGVNALLVPFDMGGEKEQTIRAETLHRAGFADYMAEAALSGEAIAHWIETRVQGRAAPRFALNREGAAESVRRVVALRRKFDDRLASKENFVASLTEAREAGRPVRFWWRDDDATEVTEPLQRLLALRRDLAIPVALAVIPDGARPCLAEKLASEPEVSVLVHGFAHRDHSNGLGKKQELLARRGVAVITRELAEGHKKLARFFGEQSLPVLTPPWNRIDPEILAALPGAGFRAVSMFADKDHGPLPPDLARFDTHLDPIDWRAGGVAIAGSAFFDEAARVVRRVSQAGLEQPIGLLTHHRQHDPWIWALVEEFLRTIRNFAPDAFVDIRNVLARTDKAFLAFDRVAKPKDLS